MDNTLLQQIRTLAKEHDMLPRSGHILCAVSGGLDSMSLLHILADLSAGMGFSLSAAHFNHRLRDAADEDEAFVRTWCSARNIPLICGNASVADQARASGRGIEETARDLRYAFLEDSARRIGADRIATAHTANDNAETLLLHLVRGCGLQGLSGIPPRRGSIVRPLLNTPRAQLEEYCRLHSIPHVEDITNTDETYTRNFVRRQIIPLLEQINPRAAVCMADSATKLRADNEYLNRLAAQAVSAARVTSDGVIISVGILQPLPRPIAVRCVQQLLALAGCENCTAAHRDRLLALCSTDDPSAQANLPGVTARRIYDELILSPPAPPQQSASPVPLNLNGDTVYGQTGWVASCRRVQCPRCPQPTSNTFFLSARALGDVPVLRPRQTGDTIKLPGRDRKTLKKLLIDEKIPLLERSQIPVLAVGTDVLALAGFGPNVSALAADGEDAYEIFLRKSEKNGKNSSRC